MNLTVAQIKRLRGVILEMVYSGHRNQESRMDSIALWGLLQGIGFKDLPLNDLHTTLQELRDREYLRFEEKRDRKTGDIRISLIQITPAARDLVEKTVREDPAVLIL
jgi:hypothetical protein